MPAVRSWAIAACLIVCGAAMVRGSAPATRVSTVPATTASAPATPPVARTAPASAPVTPANFSTPANTAKTLLTALNHADFVTARIALDIPAAQASNIDALLETMQTTAALQDAAAARFLTAGEKAFGKPTPAQLATQLKVVDAAALDVQGNAATLVIAADAASQVPGGTVKLKKMGADWKIDGAAFFKLETEPADKTAQRVALTKKITEISQATAKEIAAGTFFSAADAYQEYWTRCQKAAQP